MAGTATKTATLAPRIPSGVVPPADLQDGDLWVDETAVDGAPPITGSPGPDAHRLKAWSFDPVHSNAVGNGIGAVLGVKLIAPVDFPIASVVLNVNSQSACTNAYVGIYNAAGVLLGKSANQATAFATAGVKTITVTAEPGQSLAMVAGQVFYVGIVIGGGTSPTFAASVGSGVAGVTNIGLTAADGYRGWSYGAGLIALPANIPLANTGTMSSLRWFGVK